MRPELRRREAIREAAAAYLLRNGLAGMSLRPMAQAIGTSARLLIYHFGTREGLLIDVMGLIRRRARQDVEAMLRGASPDPDLAVLLRSFWRWCTAATNRPYLRLLFEVHGLALQNPKQYGAYLEGAVSHWIELLSSALAPALGREAKATATLMVGAIDGLLMDYLSTGDLRRTSRAVDLLARALSSRGSRHR